MINLSLRDLIKGQVYVVRYGGKQHFTTSNYSQIKQIKKCLRILGFKANQIHVYKISIEKER